MSSRRRAVPTRSSVRVGPNASEKGHDCAHFCAQKRMRTRDDATRMRGSTRGDRGRERSRRFERDARGRDAMQRSERNGEFSAEKNRTRDKEEERHRGRESRK